MSYLFFDAETAGLPSDYDAPPTDTDNWPRIVQLAWTYLSTSADPDDVTSHIVQPDGFSIPPQAVNIHGITTERAQSEGMPLDDVLASFRKDVNATDVLVAHNVAFDASVVGAELVRRHGDNPLDTLPSICTMKQSTTYCALPGSRGYKWPTLQELHTALFDHPFDGAHDAGEDVVAGANCFRELVRRGVIETPENA